MTTQEKILVGAQELFFKFGIKSMTMDDIAKHLGMSKKTIYQFFSDKNELVITLMQTHVKINENDMCTIQSESKNAIHEIFISIQHINQIFAQTNPLLFHDMQKYHTAAWNLFKEFKANCIGNFVVKNLKRGINEGFYRDDINIKIMAQLRLQEIEMAFIPEIFPATEYSLSDVAEQLLKHFLFGICTLKGHKMVNKYFEIKES